MYQHYFTKFLNGHQHRLHFAAHSHHFWPDSSLKGQIQAWEFASYYSDHKWEHFFSTTYSHTQKLLAQIMGLKKPQRLCFASNTHDHLIKILSTLDWSKKIRVLTTDSEFYSFERQIRRLQELTHCEIIKIKTDEHLETTLADELLKNYDLVFLSHVSFKNSRLLQIDNLLDSIKKCSSVVVIDAYHAIGAVPTNFEKFEDRCFILGGGYKYLMSGEGLAFMSVPDGDYRPVITGWFSDISHLTQTSHKIHYGSDGSQFMGATFDPTPFFRFNHIWDQFFHDQVQISVIHNYVNSLMKYFLKESATKNIVFKNLDEIGHFLTIRYQNVAKAQEMNKQLQEKHIICDTREENLRIGFGLYQTQQDVEKLIEALR